MSRLQSEGCVVPEIPTDLDISAASKKRQNDLDEKSVEAAKPRAATEKNSAVDDAVASEGENDVSTSHESGTPKESPTLSDSRAEKVSDDVDEDEEAEF